LNSCQTIVRQKRLIFPYVEAIFFKMPAKSINFYEQTILKKLIAVARIHFSSFEIVYYAQM
jgi:hypothetical protein